jgi:hypothetical protein
MLHNPMKICIICLSVGLFFIFMNTNGFAGGSLTFTRGKDKETETHQMQSKNKKGGPPAHAPAHGYRAKHQYRYYPDCRIYHDTERGLYFYLKGDNWEIGTSLPIPLKDALGCMAYRFQAQELSNLHNAEHVKQYPPKKSKDRHKKWAHK